MLAELYKNAELIQNLRPESGRKFEWALNSRTADICISLNLVNKLDHDDCMYSVGVYV